MGEHADVLPLIDVRGIRVDYGDGLLALDGLDLCLPRGCHGLLGVNGAGKSTLLKVLLGLLRPRAGSGTVLGEPIHGAGERLRLRIGYMPESDAHLGDLPAIESVAMLGELSGLGATEATRRAHEVLHYCGLGEARMRSADGFSAGMRQRLKLAGALVHDPELLFLDEPANGLDPAGRETMLAMLREVAARGVSIIVSTHLLPDVHELCDSVVIVSKGRVVRSGRVDELITGLADLWRIQIDGSVDAYAKALEAEGLEPRLDNTRGVVAVQCQPHSGTTALFRAAVNASVGIRELSPGTKSIEDVFFESIEEPHGHS
ncbi:MAG: ABC transporter ATP-binding protein [Planctomycetes bacterium]|nr:ABC transporter ATP-binding protein [Planctomycetota bacterium]